MKNKTLAISLLVAVLLNVFAINTPFGIGPSIFLVGLVFCVVGLFTDKKKTLSSFLLAMFASFLAVMPSISANHFLRSFNLQVYFAVLYLIILMNGFEYSKDNLFWWIISALKSLPVFFFLKKRINPIESEENNASDSSRKKIQIIASTFLITLFVLVVFGSLLSSADPVFSRLISEFFDTFLERLFLSVLVVGFVLLTSVFRYKPADTECDFKKAHTGSILFASSSLILLFALFIFVQIKYLFADETVFKALDITYSDYVRAGFTQLLWVGALGLVLSYFLHIRTKVIAIVKQQAWLRISNFVLITELFAILLSAAKRNWMYVSAYGLTRIRWVGGIFLVWLAMVFCLMALLVATKKATDKLFVTSFMVLGILAVMLMNLINMDKVIVNYRPSDDFKRIDYYYLSLLSEDVIDSWFGVVSKMEADINWLTSKNELVDDEKKQLASIKLALFNMDYKINHLKIKYSSDQGLVKKNICNLLYSYYPADKYRMYADCLLRAQNEDESLAESDYWLDEYADQRKWQAWNFSEHLANNSLSKLSSQDSSVFLVLYKKIESYQLKNNLPLWSEIRWRINNFEAPMVNKQPYYEIGFDDFQSLEKYGVYKTDETVIQVDDSEIWND